MTMRWPALCRSVRSVLARRMHALYLAEHAYVRQLSSQPAAADEPSPDNPDQRMTTDLTLLAQLLRRVLVEFGTAPFKIVFYTWWMWTYTGCLAIGVIYSFAILGTILQRFVWLRNADRTLCAVSIKLPMSKWDADN